MHFTYSIVLLQCMMFVNADADAGLSQEKEHATVSRQGYYARLRAYLNLNLMFENVCGEKQVERHNGGSQNLGLNYWMFLCTC